MAWWNRHINLDYKHLRIVCSFFWVHFKFLCYFYRLVCFFALFWCSISSPSSDILRTMQKSEDTSIYDKVLNAIFDEEMLSTKHIRPIGRLSSVGDNSSSLQYADFVTEVRDYVVDIHREIFRQHCARHLEISTMRLLDDCPQFNRSIALFKYSTALLLLGIDVCGLTA